MPQKVSQRFFWPPLTDDPKIEYIGFFQTDYDVLKRQPGFLEDVIFGRERPRVLLHQPFDVFAQSSRKRFFVSEARMGHVQIVDLGKVKLDKLKDREGRDHFFKLPLGITGDTAGNVYVVDSLAKKVFVFGPENFLLSEWRGDFFDRPVNIAVDKGRNRAFVVDTGQHKVIVLTLDEGEYVGEIGERGVADGRFNFPVDVDVDKYGNVYVLDAMSARIQVFSSDGAFKHSFGERGTALGSFELPKGISVSLSDHVYVTDSKAHKVVVFDLSGEHLMTFGGRYSVAEGNVMPGGFYMPQGIDVDGEGGVWVVDTLNRMIHQFQYLDRKYLGEHPILPGQKAIPVIYRDLIQ